MVYRATANTESRKAQVHENILKAAKALVSENGFRTLSVQAVAERAGIATGTLYRYFDSKTALCVALFERATQREIAQVTAASEIAGSSTDKLQHALTIFAERAMQNPTLAYALIAEPVDPELDQARLDYRRQWADTFSALIRTGIRKQEFISQPEQLCAAAMVGAMAEALITPDSSHLTPQQRKKQIQQLVQFCMRAVIRNPGA
ncbi:MAG: TetR/AcrR family transcriptional regulator [Gammaproteobacteria bacterium]|jgi:AcrR family transcriptional regulator